MFYLIFFVKTCFLSWQKNYFYSKILLIITIPRNYVQYVLFNLLCESMLYLDKKITFTSKILLIITIPRNYVQNYVLFNLLCKSMLDTMPKFFILTKKLLYFKDLLNNHNPKKLYSNICSIIFFVKAYLTLHLRFLSWQKNY